MWLRHYLPALLISFGKSISLLYALGLREDRAFSAAVEESSGRASVRLQLYRESRPRSNLKGSHQSRFARIPSCTLCERRDSSLLHTTVTETDPH